MKLYETTLLPQNPTNGDYVSIFDDGFQADRRLYIEDDEGNIVVLKK